MMTHQIILRQIQLIPPRLQKEVLDFIDYLFNKYNLEQQKPEKKRPKFGSGEGKYKMTADFDAPLED